MSHSDVNSSSDHILAIDFGGVPRREKKQAEADPVFSTVSSASRASSTAVRMREFKEHHQREPGFGTELVDVTNQTAHLASAVRRKKKAQKSARTQFQMSPSPRVQISLKAP